MDKKIVRYATTAQEDEIDVLPMVAPRSWAVSAYFRLKPLFYNLILNVRRLKDGKDVDMSRIRCFMQHFFKNWRPLRGPG